MIKKLIFILSIVLLTSTANALTAEWIANPVGDQVITYTLYYKQEGYSQETKVNSTTNGVSIGDSSFDVGVPYVFSVSATNAIGESVKSDEVKYTIPVDPPDDDELVPETPSGIKITIERPVIVE